MEAKASGDQLKISLEKRKGHVATVIEKALLKSLLNEGKIHEEEYIRAVSVLEEMKT